MEFCLFELNIKITQFLVRVQPELIDQAQRLERSTKLDN